MSWPLLTRRRDRLQPEDGIEQIPKASGSEQEGARSDNADDGQEDQLVASRRDSGDQQPNNAAVKVEIRERGFQGTAGRTSRETELEASASRRNGTDFSAVPRHDDIC